jgi:hypothetical protein
MIDNLVPSMAADPRIPDALDEFLTRLRADLDAHGAALTATVLEHSQQGEEAWRARIDEAEARFADERLAFERQLADERLAREQLADERLAHDRQLTDERLALTEERLALEAQLTDDRLRIKRR